MWASQWYISNSLQINNFVDQPGRMHSPDACMLLSQSGFAGNTMARFDRIMKIIQQQKIN